MSLKRNVIANFLGQGWAALMAIAFVPVYIKFLGIEAYGLIGLFVVIQAWLALLDMGMTPTLTREMARFEAGEHSPQAIGDLLRTLELVCVGVAVLICGGMALVASWLVNHWLNADGLAPQAMLTAVYIAAFVIALRFVEGLYRGAIYGLQRQVWFNAANAVVSTVRGVGVIGVLAWVAPTVEAFLLWQLVLAIVPVVLYAWKTHSVLPRAPRRVRFSSRALADVGQFAGGMMGTTALVLLLTQVDKVLLSRLLSLEAFGYYALASAVAAALQVLLGPITAAVYPRMVALVGGSDSRPLVTLFHFAAQMITVALAPAALVLAFHAQGALFAWSGDAVLAARAAPVLSVLVLGTLLNGLLHVPYQLQLAHGWTGLAVKANLVAVAVLVPAILWLVPTYGGIAAAWIWVVLNAGYVIVSAPLMFHRLLPSEQRAWYVRDLAVPASGVVATMVLTLSLQPADYSDRWRWLAFLMLTAALSFATAACLAPQVRARLPFWRGRRGTQ